MWNQNIIFFASLSTAVSHCIFDISGLAFISSPVTLQNNFLIYQISLSRCFVSVGTNIYIVTAPIITSLIFKLNGYRQVKKIKANNMENTGQNIFLKVTASHLCSCSTKLYIYINVG